MATSPDVSADAVVDFDHHSDEFNLNQQTINAELRQKCPVAWNENYGGFWFLSSYDAVSRTARDDDTFSHKYEPNAANGVDYIGLTNTLQFAPGETLKRTVIPILNNGLKAMDSTAITLCMDNDLPIVMFDLMGEGNVRGILEGRAIGTLVR